MFGESYIHFNGSVKLREAPNRKKKKKIINYMFLGCLRPVARYNFRVDVGIALEDNRFEINTDFFFKF